MKIIIIVIISMSFLSASFAEEVMPKNTESVLIAKENVNRRPARKRVRSSSLSATSSWGSVSRLIKAGNYEKASLLLYKMSLSSKYRKHKAKVTYLLGLSLFKMKLYQTSAFQFIRVVNSGNRKYVNKALEKLSIAADYLGDEAMLNYAIGKINIKRFPKAHRDMLYNRIGEFQVRSKQFKQAIRTLSRVKPESPFYSKSKYLQALSYSELKRNKKAIRAFDQLIQSRSDKRITDIDRASAMMGKARVYYQAKQWEKAIDAYRDIPRDTESWHDTLFESSWAMLRAEKFRSALSNFQSLHSPYYESYYMPESLILRSIIYLFICKYDEMEKVLNLFNRVYQPVYKKVKSYLTKAKSYNVYYNDLVDVIKKYNENPDSDVFKKSVMPLTVARKIGKEGDFNRTYKYIQKLIQEKKRVDKMGSAWKSSGIGRYANKVVSNRLIKVRKKAGKIAKTHMINMKADLFDLFEQEAFVRYEMINSKKELLKKKVAGKEIRSISQDDKRSRSFYVKNGYEYWPFQGEYWLDELGNYHFVGTHSCGR